MFYSCLQKVGSCKFPFKFYFYVEHVTRLKKTEVGVAHLKSGLHKSICTKPSCFHRQTLNCPFHFKRPNKTQVKPNRMGKQALSNMGPLIGFPHADGARRLSRRTQVPRRFVVKVATPTQSRS
jgi:hypothetical protein